NDLRKDLEKTWENLKKWLMRWESKEIADLCGGVTWPWTGYTGAAIGVKEMCKGVVEIGYFINGVEIERVGQGFPLDHAARITENMAAEEIFRRCIVGSVALTEIYGDHCGLKVVIEKIENGMNDKLTGTHRVGSMFDKCKGVDLPALMVGKSLLHGRIKEWAAVNRGGKGPARVRSPWTYWKQVCPPVKKEEELAKKEAREKNKEKLTQFMGLNNGNTQNNIGSVSIADVLTGDQFLLKQDKLDAVLQSALKEGDKFDVNSLTQKLTKSTEEKTGKYMGGEGA
ncbi:SICAvar, type I (fragment), partial [Plasmodium knowlesi strain H]